MTIEQILANASEMLSTTNIPQPYAKPAIEAIVRDAALAVAPLGDTERRAFITIVGTAILRLNHPDALPLPSPYADRLALFTLD